VVERTPFFRFFWGGSDVGRVGNRAGWALAVELRRVCRQRKRKEGPLE
jgi:hypothetical protein